MKILVCKLTQLSRQAVHTAKTAAQKVSRMSTVEIFSLALKGTLIVSFTAYTIRTIKDAIVD